jgi:hypothetical protein
MKYAVEMGTGAMIYIPSFIKIDSAIQKLIGGIHRYTDTHRQYGDRLRLFLRFQNKESRLKLAVSLSLRYYLSFCLEGSGTGRRNTRACNEVNPSAYETYVLATNVSHCV